MTRKFRGHLYQHTDGTFRLDTFEIEEGNDGSCNMNHKRFDGWKVLGALQEIQALVSEALVAQKNSGC